MDQNEVIIAGAAHDDGRDDLAWALRQPSGSAMVRALGYALRKALHRCTSSVTVDLQSFARAMAGAPPQAFFVLVPSHRSYFDFLLASYLCFQHPELGIPIPHIAAAEEFSRIPIAGRVLKQAQAFYIRRAVGKEDPRLSADLRRLTARSGSLMFFIEGQRSRARRVLPPKRGLLRGLQGTGNTFTLLPLAISYDRVPEESSFDTELTGGAKPPMTLRALFKWLGQLARGQVQLGRIHIACGQPAALTATTEIVPLTTQLVAEQQRCTTTTDFHLRMFLAHARLPGIDVAWLAEAIGRRGGRVLKSNLPLPEHPSAALQQSLRNQWMHWFFPDALALFPDNLAVRDHIDRQRWLLQSVASDTADSRVRRVVEALLLPVVLDYDLVTRRLGAPGQPLAFSSPRALLKAYPVAHLPTLEDAYHALAERNILVALCSGEFTWGTAAATVSAFSTGLTKGFVRKAARHYVAAKGHREAAA